MDEEDDEDVIEGKEDAGVSNLKRKADGEEHGEAKKTRPSFMYNRIGLINILVNGMVQKVCIDGNVLLQ